MTPGQSSRTQLTARPCKGPPRAEFGNDAGYLALKRLACHPDFPCRADTAHMFELQLQIHDLSNAFNDIGQRSDVDGAQLDAFPVLTVVIGIAPGAGRGELGELAARFPEQVDNQRFDDPGWREAR